MPALRIPASRLAVTLGMAGLVPFVVLASCLWFVAPEWQPVFARALAGWAALVLAFSGAVHWGAALYEGEGPENGWRYLYGVCPALLAWVALLLPVPQALFLIFWGYVAAFVVDRRVWPGHDWYVILRAALTILASACLFAGYKALQ
ncbi:MAG: DUF3429 domain-containing protein [Rhodospirillales bacterium]|nr:DUF3429 domain-containing protein [Alphaproteobacteria bacterium]MCB9986024.1 DUF3429 domain-containing protein [Rhodospirillales bacterium]USO07402.1 MAG: DUF3429 domain-containing protein [Rhodospirillales bacterium]